MITSAACNFLIISFTALASLLLCWPIFSRADISCCPSTLTSVLADSTLPLHGSAVSPTNQVALLKSYSGTYVLEIAAWLNYSTTGSATSFCMAAVRHTQRKQSTIWAANGAIPIAATTCQMKLDKNGDFSLQFNGTLTAWHTNTANLGAQNLSLEESGNLVLLGGQGRRPVWQSFDESLIFLLLPGMNFTKNTTLLSSNPLLGNQDFTVAGDYGMALGNQGLLLLFVTKKSSQFVYFSIGSPNLNTSVAYVNIENTGLTFYAEDSTLLQTIQPNLHAAPTNYSSITVRITQSGNLLASFRESTSNRSWHEFYKSSISSCEKPSHCGIFALCDPITNNCSCPTGFVQNQNQPFDCEAPTLVGVNAETCSSDQDIEWGTYHVSFHPQRYSLSPKSEEECRLACAGNCSCRAALYDSGSRSCSLFKTIQTLPKANEESTQLLLLKVQSSAKGHMSGKKRRLVIGILTGGIAAILICLTSMFTIWRKKRCHPKAAATDETFLHALPRLPPRFSLKELQSATREFSSKLGSGGFGSVYEGVLDTGMKVAVKKLEGAFGQSSEQFKTEVATIGRVSHVNLVGLKGFCMEGESRMLVFEHMANGSLDRWLFRDAVTSDIHLVKKEDEPSDNQEKPPSDTSDHDHHAELHKVLDWETRCRVALDTAKGLAYLHHECGERIVHCDVKPENILLDEGFNAKVADFGIATLVGGGKQSFVITTLKGTRGYLAPEWLQEATITAKSDVYSYGVVLLELLTGRRCLDPERGYLPNWVVRQLLGTTNTTSPHGQYTYNPPEESNVILGFIDERIAAEPSSILTRMVRLALWCVQPDPNSRPSMTTVVQMLEGFVDVLPPPLRFRHPSLELSFYPFTEASQILAKSRP